MIKFLFSLVLLINFISCSALMEDSTSKSKNNSLKRSSANLKNVISSARYDVDNIQIYSNTKEYMGTIISTQGIFVEQKF